VTRLTRSPSVALLGEQAPPRVLHAPDARHNSWEDAVELSASFGLTLDPWQEAVLRAGLGERANGKWVSQQVGLCAPRQNGKSQLIVSRALAGVLLFGERKVVISAHQQDTARETFGKFMELIESNPSLEARLFGGSVRTGVMNAVNREHIKFANGAIIKFKARSGAGGRGFSSDCLFLDEAQILGPRAWASINSTMSAMENPQVWLLGTPPTPEDDGEIFERIREAGIAKKGASLTWIEWGAEPATKNLDWRSWGQDVVGGPEYEAALASANPAWHTRINLSVVKGEAATYSPNQFALERLGIWTGDDLARVIDLESWGKLKGDAPTEARISYGVKFSIDGSGVALAGARRPDEGPVFVEVIDSKSMAHGVTWLAEWLAERWRDTACITIDGKGGALALVAALRSRKVRASVILTPTSDQAIAAYAGLLDAVTNKTIAHSGQPGLEKSVASAGRRDIGGLGGWGLKPITQDGDVTPVEAVALALYGARTSKRRPGHKAVIDF